jgi:hypothetical protein
MRAVTFRVFLATLPWVCTAVGVLAQPERPIRIRPEKREPAPQALAIPPEPPAALAAEARRLSFQTSPLSGKGLLSQQVRDALRAIDRANGSARLVKIRAFVAGTGDMRRVQQIVSEDFHARKIPLPVVSTIQAGGLPREGAQVLIEAVSEERRIVNPEGVRLLAARPAADVRDSALALREAAAGGAILRATCFLHSLERAEEARKTAAAVLPGVPTTFVQLTRLATQPLAACEGVAGGWRGSGATGKVVFTGIQMAFGEEESGLRLAFERAWKAAESAGAAKGAALHTSVYLLSAGLLERARSLGERLVGGPSTTLVVEGLPSLDVSMAVEMVAPAP